MKIHPIIAELMSKLKEYDVSSEIIIKINDDGDLSYHVDGFYKSGVIELKSVDGVLMAFSRYDQVDEINALSDLVGLNAEWWSRSKTKSPGWEKPSTRWVGLLKEHGLISPAEA